MRIHTVPEFLNALERSELLRDKYLAQIREQVAAARADLSVERLANSLLRSRTMTRFQLERLLAGHSEGFYLGQYKLCDVLGQGGMGTVYLAEQTSKQRFVALKIIRNLEKCPPDTLVRFRREAHASLQLSHENVVESYSYEEQNGVPMLVMEYAEGLDAAEIVERHGRLAWQHTADLMMQAALGLEHLRLQGLVHRDIKPGNLLVASDGTLKIMDLGLCLWVGDEADALKTRDIQVGTVDFMAPEQAVDCRAVDSRADIYSLGCVFYALLAGHLPFPASTAVQKLLLHRTAEPRPIHQHRHDLPTPLADIIHTMLEKRPEDRFQTPGVVAEALKPWAERADPPYPLDDIEHRRDRLRSVLGRSPKGRRATSRDRQPALATTR